MWRLICLLVITFPIINGEICLVCKCSFVNVSTTDFLAKDIEKFTFEPFVVNATNEPQNKYLYIDCSSENIVGRINKLQWPKVNVTGILAYFPNSGWESVETFPENVTKHIKILSLSRNSILEIKNSQLEEFSSLRLLNLSHNKIESIEKGIFNKLSLLTNLDLSRNGITHMDDWCFYGTNLRHLNLSKNQIVQINSDVFRGLSNLTVLDLSENKIVKLSEDFGNFLTSLRFLTLKKNELEKLPELPKSLKIFDVSYNRFDDLHLSHLNLESLDISNNQLLSLDHTHFPSLEVLRASNNQLKQISDINSNQIIILDLSYNKFTKIPDVATSDKLPFLQELYLDGNRITNISFPQQSEPFTNLRILSLSYLKSVKKILKTSFLGVFPNREYDCSKETGLLLNLSHNSIKFVDKDVFLTFSVCSIDFSHNQLRSLSESLLPWEKLSYVNLQNNPWQCDCNIQWMLDDFLVFMYTNHPRLLFELRCDTPMRYRNKMFASWLNKSDHVFCNSGPSSFYLDLMGGKKVEIWTASAITCVILAVFILITAVVIVVLACTRPSKRKRKSIHSIKRKGPPYYKQIQSNIDKNQELGEKPV